MFSDRDGLWRKWVAKVLGLSTAPSVTRRRRASVRSLVTLETRVLLSANPVINPQNFAANENSPATTVVGSVVASDPDAVKSALSFDGVDDYVSVANSTSLRVGSATSGTNSAFTIEAWVNLD